MANLTVRIPNDLKKALQEFCKRQNRTMCAVTRESLQRHLAAERFRSLRRKTLPFAEAQGILTDEEVFRIVS